jgi:Phosphopantetheine attachment site
MVIDQAPERETGGDAPADRLEETLLAIWRSVLDSQSIGVHDDFFECGGDSLLAARALARIQKSFGKPVSLAMLFNAGTAAALADALRKDPAFTVPSAPSRAGSSRRGATSRFDSIARWCRAALNAGWTRQRFL